MCKGPEAGVCQHSGRARRLRLETVKKDEKENGLRKALTLREIQLLKGLDQWRV